MNPYLFTLVFLMMMSLLASSEVVRFSQATLEHKCYTDSRDELAEAQEMHALSQLDALKEEINPTPNHRPQAPSKPKKSSAKRIISLQVNTARPPNNARLNIYNLLYLSSKYQGEFSLYETLACLMRNLYKEEPFFQQISRAEYLILDRLIDKKDNMASFTTPDELSTLNLGDDNLQEIFYYMFKGTKRAPPLLNYLTFDKVGTKGNSKKWKINLLFTDPHILKAIFPNQEIAEKIARGRAEIWEEIVDQENRRLNGSKEEGKGRTYFNKKLEAVLKEALEGKGLDYVAYEKIFDLTLGHSGNVIFLTDSETGNVTRTKFTHESNKTL